MMILFAVYLMGLFAMIRAAALVSTPLAWAACAVSCFAIVAWPWLRARLADPGVTRG